MTKYKAIKTEIDGIKFDSKLEAKRYNELKLMQRCGVITDLKCQVPFLLVSKSKWGRDIKYIADFTYNENGKEVVEDTKSTITKTPVYRLKKRLLAEKYGIEIKEVYK